jgi:ABC-type antimicrobial peptide transport system permease subunit
MLAGCLYYLEFAKQDLYHGFLENDIDKQLDFNSWSSYQGNGKTFDDIMASNAFLEQKISLHDLELVARSAPLYPRSFLFESIIYREESYLRVIRGYYGLNNFVLDDCIVNSRFPVNQSEILAFVPVNNSLAVNDQVNLTFNYVSDGNLTSHDLTLTITGIITNSSLKSDSRLRGLFSLNQFQFFSSLELFTSLISDIETELLDEVDLEVNNEYQLDLDFSNIKHGEAVETVNKLLAFMKDIDDSRYQSRLFFYQSHYQLSASIMNIEGFFFQFFLISIPVLILVCTLVFFSLGLINEQRQKITALIKTRGVSNSFIFLVLFIETFIVALIAVAISMVAGVPVAILLGGSSGFLEFSRVADYDIVLNQLTLQNLVVLGFAMTFVTHAPAIIKLSRSEVVLLEQQASKKKKRRTGILSSNTDVLLLTTGLLGMIIFNLFMEIIRNAGAQQGLLALFLPFIMLFLLVSPLAFLLGSLITYNRFIPLILHQLGGFFWKKNLRVLATAARNLNSNVKVTTRATLLVAITLSFLIIMTIFPVSASQYQVDSLYYDNGADIKARVNLGDEDSFQELVNDLDSIPGLKVMRVIIVRDDSYSWSSNEQYSNYFIGIEPNFDDLAHWQDYYNDKTLEELVSSLYSSPLNNTLMVDSKKALEESIILGESYQLTLHEGYDNQEKIEIIPVAIAGYFPGLITRWSNLNRFFACKYSYALHLNENHSLYGSREAWGKILPGYDPETVTEQFIETMESNGHDAETTVSVPVSLEQAEKSLSTSLSWLVVNYNFLGALAVIMAAIALFGYARIAQNTRELALGRALGMKYHQMFALMTTEPVLLFLLSGLPGALIGLSLMVGLIQMFGQNLFWGPPFILDFNLPVIMVTYGMILLAMILLGVIISFKSTKANISEILKTE